jgi:hypothetical protein
MNEVITSISMFAVMIGVTDMHTGEFAALRDAVIAEHQRRTGDLQVIAA